MTIKGMYILWEYFDDVKGEYVATSLARKTLNWLNQFSN